MDTKSMKAVFTITERGGKSFWTRIGVAMVNRDGSWNLKLDAIPINGSMQVREWEERREWEDRRAIEHDNSAVAANARRYNDLEAPLV
jgi:hypothetical protein